ncbi:unnamed protein product [Dibothriocephalus latus]|uniref:Uncharacterized protein n=1 Tax=Dibothriocephalus latus TaxID=60516 RepID=A0A3P7NQU5_DIBLA|nr:unnamed protein product [Dibothriocephalus latus]
MIVAVLLQEAFHRRVFAIEFTRHFDSICQAYVYDDHLDADSLFSLTCQFYTVTSLLTFEFFVGSIVNWSLSAAILMSSSC